jgi:hypothetical protein
MYVDKEKYMNSDVGTIHSANKYGQHVYMDNEQSKNIDPRIN